MVATVTDNADRSRFELRVDGALAGFAVYHLHRGTAAFTHTQIDEQFTRQGLASTLIRDALDDARGRGWTVEPFCPFVRAFIAKHEDYRDLVAPDQWTRFHLGSE